MASTVYETEICNADSSFAVTFQILEDFTTKGKPKLIDSRG